MSLPSGLMAPTIIDSDAVQGETCLPGQISVFGGFALRANSLGHLEQIKSYAPGRQVRFGSLNYTADIRGDLIFDGFEPLPSAPHCHDEHDLALPPNSALKAAPASASTLNSEPTAPIEDGWLDAVLGVFFVSFVASLFINWSGCKYMKHNEDRFRFFLGKIQMVKTESDGQENLTLKHTALYT